MNTEKGYKLSKETKEKMSKNRVGMLGKNHSDKSKLKISNSLIIAAHELLRKRPISDKQIELLKRKLVPRKEKIRIINSRSRIGYNKNNKNVHLAHNRIDIEVKKLEKEGFKCIPIGKVIPDIIAIKNGKIYAIEVEYGKPNYSKYDKNNYKKHFHEVKWIIKNKKYVNHN